MVRRSGALGALVGRGGGDEPRLVGALGVSLTAKHMPDDETGLGWWTLRNLAGTIRTGRHLGRGRAILPPMPTPAYNNLSDAELEPIYRYLRTAPALKSRVPEPWAPVAQTGGAPQCAAYLADLAQARRVVPRWPHQVTAGAFALDRAHAR